MNRSGRWMLAFALAASTTAFAADPRTDYYQRVAERDMALFTALDVDHDGTLTRVEIQGDLDLGPRFNDIDINRDGVVTRDELRRYVEQHYGVQVPAAPK
jgi:hypothetical protein